MGRKKRTPSVTALAEVEVDRISRVLHRYGQLYPLPVPRAVLLEKLFPPEFLRLLAQLSEEMAKRPSTKFKNTAVALGFEEDDLVPKIFVSFKEPGGRTGTRANIFWVYLPEMVSTSKIGAADTILELEDPPDELVDWYKKTKKTHVLVTRFVDCLDRLVREGHSTKAIKAEWEWLASPAFRFPIRRGKVTHQETVKLLSAFTKAERDQIMDLYATCLLLDDKAVGAGV